MIGVPGISTLISSKSMENIQTGGRGYTLAHQSINTIKENCQPLYLGILCHFRLIQISNTNTMCTTYKYTTKHESQAIKSIPSKLNLMPKLHLSQILILISNGKILYMDLTNTVQHNLAYTTMSNNYSKNLLPAHSLINILYLVHHCTKTLLQTQFTEFCKSSISGI